VYRTKNRFAFPNSGANSLLRRVMQFATLYFPKKKNIAVGLL